MRGILHDVRYAVRLLLRAPGFAAVVVLTLALGIGANTAIFSAVYGVLLKPLPYAAPERLVTVWQDMTARGGPAKEWTTPGNFVDLAARRDLFESVTAVRGWQPTLTGLGDPESLAGEQVTWEYFGAFGVVPSAGRLFAAEDDVPDAARVAVLSHGLWMRRFGGDPGVVGRRVMLGGEVHEIVGVLPAGFRPALSGAAEIWRPGRLNRTAPARGMIVLHTFARLAPGVTLEQAAAAVRAMSRDLARLHPDDNRDVTLAVVDLHGEVVGDIRPSLLALLASVGFVLLIACANVANLLLARAAGRTREIAVRLALGAGRARIVRQLLVESALLAAVGGAAGLLLAAWGMAALTQVAPTIVPAAGRMPIDMHVLLFTAGLTLLTGALFGSVPALQASRRTLAPALAAGGRTSTGDGGQRVRRALVVAEVALALVLLVGSGLLLKTFVSLQSSDLGFEPSGVLAGTILPSRTAYPTPGAQAALFDRLLEAARALPGVETAALTSVLPLTGDTDTDVTIEGLAPPPSGGSRTSWYRVVSAEYLTAMRIPVRRGRMFAPRDPVPSVVVNETAAARFWPGADPIGRRVRLGGASKPWLTVVAVAGDVHMNGPRDAARIEMYVPYWQVHEGGTNVVLKTGGRPESLMASLRAAVRTIDPDLPVSNLAPVSALVETSIAQPRALALLAAIFAGLALALSAIGIYGVMSYDVARRTSEIGLRMALGARRHAVLALVIREGLALTALGIGIGAAAAAAVGQALGTLLFGVAPTDPTTFLFTAGALVVTALAATLLPARRATRVDPLVALRHE